MSTNPQWKSFQPPDTMNQDSAIIDFKPMTSNGKASQAFNYSNNRSTSTSRFGQEFPMLQQQDKSSSSSNHHSQQQQQQQHHHHHHHHHHSHSSSSVGNFGTAASNPSSSATTNGLYGSSSTTHASSRFPPIGTFMLDTNNMYNSSGDGSGVVSSSNSVSNNSMSTNNMVSGVFSTSAMNGNSGSNGGNGAGNPVTSSSTNSYNNSSSSNSGGGNNDSNSSNLGTRETGIIEKLLHSYGFIQCCERQARLFFHFSQFSGNIEHLKIGDPVEFEMTYDRRTGKPIASSVTKIAPEVVMSEERVTGTVTTEVRGEGSGGDATGRISYENRGECFFLPYTKDDVEGNVTLRSGDKVSFQIATNNRGNLGACHVRLENPAHPVKYQGVVCSMKESFGFIERADVVKEIFFHFSEAKTKEELRLGDDVEFTIQTRNGKEVACNITRLPTGTVIFEDLKPEIMKGQVLKPLDRGLNARQQLQQSQQQQILLQQQQQQQQADALPGRIRYRAPDHSEVEISFGDKDQKGDFTLRHGDWVQFKIATDRRDGLNRATNISLLDESFLVSGERREQGVVASVKDGFGFLKCVDREARLFFHFNEILDVEREVQPGDEFEFTVVQDQCNAGGTFSSANNRQSAIRMKWSPHGTVQFETRLENQVSGTVTKEIPPTSSSSGGWPNNRSPTKNNGLLLMTNQNGEGVPEAAGCITYQAFGGVKKQVAFYSKDCDLKQFPRLGDKVEFNINQVKRNKELIAVDIQVVQPANTTPTAITIQQTANGIKHRNSTNTNNGQIYQGFIAALKEGFGFIETIQHDKEVFFHFSNFEGDPNTLELGQEVEYNLATTRNNNSNNNNNGMCSSAENVKVIPKGTITLPAVTNPDLVLDGRVVRPLRSANPEQKEYSGLIRIVKGGGEGEKQRGEDSIVVESENEMPFDENPEEGEDGKQQPQTPPVEYEFGIMGLVNKRELLQVDDHVQLQVDSTGRAANIVAVRKKLRATVDSIKGNFGFLAYEVEEGKKLFFHMTEVKDNVSLQVGDTVEFVLVNNHRSGKSSACSVVKVSDVQARPERLISRLRTVSLDEAGPKLTVVRQPKGPDGTKGFNNVAGVRSPRQPGVIPLTSLNSSVTSSSATPPVVVE